MAKGSKKNPEEKRRVVSSVLRGELPVARDLRSHRDAVRRRRDRFMESGPAGVGAVAPGRGRKIEICAALVGDRGRCSVQRARGRLRDVVDAVDGGAPRRAGSGLFCALGVGFRWAGPRPARTVTTRFCSALPCTRSPAEVCWRMWKPSTSTAAITVARCGSGLSRRESMTWSAPASVPTAPPRAAQSHIARGAPARRAHQLVVVELRVTPPQHRPDHRPTPRPVRPGHHHDHRRQTLQMGQPMEPHLITYLRAHR